MKFSWKYLLLLAAICCSLSIQAQAKGSKTQRTKPSQTEMAQKQATRIANELGFTDGTRDRFIATFVNCQQELWNLRKGQRPKKAGQLTDEQADSVVKARFDFSERTLELRRKYYAEYRKFLTPRQILQVYDQEKAIMKHLKENGRPQKAGHKASSPNSAKRQARAHSN